MLKALDLLRRLGWAVIDFIYSLIDTLFNILKELNLYDIVAYSLRRTLEEVNVDYYMFRMGLDDMSLYNQTNKYGNASYDGSSYYYSLPQYQNSFYFYFGYNLVTWPIILLLA